MAACSQLSPILPSYWGNFSLISTITKILVVQGTIFCEPWWPKFGCMTFQPFLNFLCCVGNSAWHFNRTLPENLGYLKENKRRVALPGNCLMGYNSQAPCQLRNFWPSSMGWGHCSPCSQQLDIWSPGNPQPGECGP